MTSQSRTTSCWSKATQTLEQRLSTSTTQRAERSDAKRRRAFLFMLLYFDCACRPALWIRRRKQTKQRQCGEVLVCFYVCPWQFGTGMCVVFAWVVLGGRWRRFRHAKSRHSNAGEVQCGVIPINGIRVMDTCYDPCHHERWNDEIILKDKWTKGLGPHGGFEETMKRHEARMAKM